jgi:hypothetical protein
MPAVARQQSPSARLNLLEAAAGAGTTTYLMPMQTRAEYLLAEAEECERQAAKAATATAIFIYLDLAADLKEQARRAALEDGNSKT